MTTQMLLARRRSMMKVGGGSVLPDGYTQFTWLSSIDSEGVLDTGVAVENGKDFDLETTIKWSDLSRKNVKIGTSVLFFGIGFNGGWLFCSANGIGDIGPAPQVDTEYILKLSYAGTTASIKVGDGNQYDVADKSVDGSNFCFFSQDSLAHQWAKMSVGETSIKVNGVVVAHLIPCKDSSDNYGMYNLVTSTFIAVNNNNKFTGS